MPAVKMALGEGRHLLERAEKLFVIGTDHKKSPYIQLQTKLVKILLNRKLIY